MDENIDLPLKKVIVENNLGINVKISTKTDVEGENWEKIYYHVHLEGPEFEEKMKIWDLVDDFVRSKIEELKKNRKYRLGSNAEKLEEINRNLYVLIDL